MDQGKSDRTAALYALSVLLLAYILSFIDRNVMAVLIGPIRQDFNISDFQYSLLHGFAFSMFYIFLGLPIGRMADRRSRKWIITVGVFCWTLMTCACGLARSFKALFVMRMGVGVGEAALSPPAYSLLSDYFDSDQLPKAMAVYTLGITIGGGLAYMIGGAVYEYFSAAELITVPIFGELRAWQLTFVAVGVPGFLVVLLLLWLREPPRKMGALGGTEEVPSVAELMQWLRQNWRAYGSLMLGVSLLSVLGYGTMAWYPEFLVRSHDFTRGEAGAQFGIIFIVAGSLGTLAGGWSAGPLKKRGYADANMRVVLIVALLWVVPAASGPLMPSGKMAMWMAFPIVFFLNSYFGVCIAALQLITPNQMRAQISALLLFMTNLFGLALGPSVVAALTDFVFGDDQALQFSLAILPLVVCPLAALVVWLGLSHYRQLLVRMESGE